MKAFVTGVAGFVGSSIARRLFSQRAEVVGINSFTPYYARELKDANLPSLDSHGCTFVAADMNEFDPGSRDDVDVIYHPAGQPGERSSWGSEFGSHMRNKVLATQPLLEPARDSSLLLRFVYASKSSVYGDANRFPAPETDMPRPVSPYSVMKLAGEHLVSLYETRSVLRQSRFATSPSMTLGSAQTSHLSGSPRGPHRRKNYHL